MRVVRTSWIEPYGGTVLEESRPEVQRLKDTLQIRRAGIVVYRQLTSAEIHVDPMDRRPAVESQAHQSLLGGTVHRRDTETGLFQRPDSYGLCVENTVVRPCLSNARTLYGLAFGPSIPGDPIGMPGTARPTTPAGVSFSSRWISAAGTCPSMT